MSTFAVTLCRISEIHEHPHADRLQLSLVEGMTWQFCVQKGLYEVGTEVAYFPIDSLLPDALAEFMKVKPYLAGSGKDRIKTVKLRGEVSQGIVVPSNDIRKYLDERCPGSPWPPKDLAAALGVSKYDPPGIRHDGGILKNLPSGVPIYDIEGADNYPGVIETLMGRNVCITEKLEGTNFSVTAMPEGEIMVNQRKHTIIPDDSDDEHTFWRVARERGIIAAIKAMQKNGFQGRQVTLRGEMVGPGIQGNIYDLKSKAVFFFDVLVDATYVPVDAWIKACSVYGLNHVPILSMGNTLDKWLAGKTLRDASNGISVLSDTKREGVVIKPMQEDRHDKIGRLIIKQRSPDYLAGCKL